MTGVLREVWTEFWEGGAYRDRVFVSVSWRAGKAWFIGGSGFSAAQERLRACRWEERRRGRKAWLMVLIWLGLRKQ